MAEFMVLSEEEKQMLIKHRAEQARKAEIDDCMAMVIKSLERIEKLGGKVVLPRIGGAYVSSHHPRVYANSVSCWY